MAAHPLLPDPAVLTLDSLSIHDGVIVFAARAVVPGATCPCCGWLSERVHSRYRRTLLDLPWQGNAVQIALSVRKFFCDNRSCERRVFAERFPAVAKRYARKTCRLAEALRELTYLAGGEAACRIARAFGLLVSPDALLLHLRRSSPPVSPAPRVLGVDDWAFRKGHRYGTILVDLERRRLVDLLPERSSQSLASWLKQHPGIEVISRDRAAVYAEGAAQGAPKAEQVADRWHLLHNLGEAMERLTAQHHRQLRQAAERMAPSLPEVPAAPKACVVHNLPRFEQRRLERREVRLGRYNQITALRQQGWTVQAIAGQVGVSKRTVQRFLHAPSYPERARRSRQPCGTDPFAPYLRRRFEQGCRNAAQLHREVQAQGFAGCYTSVRNLVVGFAAACSPEDQNGRTPPGPKSRSWVHSQPPVPPSRSVAWWLQGHFRSSDSHSQAQQRAFLEHLYAVSPVLKEAAELAREFIQIVKERREPALDGWLTKAGQSACPELRLFARGLTQDLAAVRNALLFEWSNGQTEGQVNRLKMLKRQMYGRASFDLLRARVLPFRAEVPTATAAVT
jgi:transposase